ncbi:phosphoribosylformylglycinamidine synthase subunit PurQ [Phaeovulum vinaykumarii]|uniref:Phosphoribosylformylglycinamidine synthase subunit PurQ n=1 Tax=Phaeovulum vinaykumarii TaxID=407234 RepID=A0A1N7ME19_9RHOB|nr:phosphoribosylformylglycinamidine synthase subunit PurQ [Phaeovulum vinaykumarii]SIS84343.1 phosphoribosylformylglycinamidine synthase subunit I [Phaeovulum vinaykumarii]SOC11720.1 phosphoribosylformylglycinamidine synthase subunit I [Phaeovulum vinaykumarii]
MKAAVITFPGSNCDRDLACAFAEMGAEVTRVWHKDDALPAGTDIVAVPGGFSYGDYLRCGAIAARSPVAAALRAHAARGGLVLGVCNGFQILTELGLLPGALMRNAALRYICRPERLIVASTDSPFTAGYALGDAVTFPIAHHDGNYVIDAEGLARLKAEGRIAFRYATNPNGSVDDIAGVLSENRRVLGMMPHPERAMGMTGAQESADGSAFFRALCAAMTAA